MEVQLERHAGFLILRIKGDMRLWGHRDWEEGLQKTLPSGLDDPPAQLLLSLGGVTHIDTTGIASLVRVLHECAKHRVSLKVVMPPGPAGEALRQVRIFDAWPMFYDETEAMQSAGA